MNLLRETMAAAAWQAGIVASFFRGQPKTTAVGVFFGCASRIAHMLAFLLPLKVILLAGSSGVPSYFRPFLNEDQKTAAIIALSVAAIASYVLALFMDAGTKKLATRAGLHVLRKANAIAIVNNQESEANDVYLQFMRLTSEFCFLIVAISVLLWLNSILAAAIVTLVIAAFIALHTAIHLDLTIGGKRIPVLITEGPFLKVLSSFTFFACFIVILVQFIMLPQANVLVAIISFVIIRQLVNVMSTLIQVSLKLTADQPLINALLSREHQYQRADKAGLQTFRQVFEKTAREDRIRQELGERIARDDVLEVLWSDPVGTNLQAFDVRVQKEATGEEERYLLRTYLSKQQFIFRNEQFLFRHVPRKRLGAPPLVAQFSQDSFICAVLDVSGTAAIPSSEAAAAMDDLLERHWAIAPSEDLVRAFSMSHSLLPERLRNDLLDRLHVAADNETEKAWLAHLNRRLGDIRDILAALPLYIHNPERTQHHALTTAKGDMQLTSWGQWSLAPIGITLPKNQQRDQMEERLQRLREARMLTRDSLSVDHLHFVNQCHELEEAIHRGHYKRALNAAGKLLANEVLRTAPTAEAEHPPAANHLALATSKGA